MYIKDALGRDLSIVKFITDGSTTSSTEYFVYGTDRVARITVGTTTPLAKILPDEATYFLYDHLGNTRVAFMVNGSNVPLIVNALDYYSYGKILREYNNGAGDRYLTTGHERDKETGLDYRGARYYDSDVARFLSTDPWANKYPAWSKYNYVMGNPLRLIDPTGKGPTDWFLNVQTGNLIYVKGTSEITQKEIDKYGWNSSPSDYKRLGADNMFGDKVPWAYNDNILDKDMYSFYNYTENFMETEGYVKGREYSVKETENITGGRQGDENVQHPQYTYEATKGDLTYVKPDELNQRDKFKDYKEKGFCWQKTTIKYETTVEYDSSPRTSAFFSDNGLGDAVSGLGSVIEIVYSIVTRNKK